METTALTEDHPRDTAAPASQVDPAEQDLSPLSVVIAADQQAIIARAEEAIDRHPRYKLSGVCSNAAMATALAEKVKPTVMVIAECLRGSTINDAVEHLHSIVPTCEAIVLTVDADNRDIPLSENIFAALWMDDADLIDKALDAVAGFLETNPADDALDSPDRRLRNEHRASQDWSTVVRERREGGRRSDDA